MLDSTETATLALDKIALAALRLADTISFHHYVGNTTGHASYISATKRHTPNARDPFAPKETDIMVPCEVSIADYDRDGGTGLGSWTTREEYAHYRCFEMIHSAQYEDGIWPTVAGSLKVGDVLKLAWVRGGQTTEALRDKGCHGDSLHLVVQRGDKRLRFLIDVSVTDNDMVRMVKRTRGYSIA